MFGRSPVAPNRLGSEAAADPAPIRPRKSLRFRLCGMTAYGSSIMARDDQTLFACFGGAVLRGRRHSAAGARVAREDARGAIRAGETARARRGNARQFSC